MRFKTLLAIGFVLGLLFGIAEARAQSPIVRLDNGHSYQQNCLPADPVAGTYQCGPITLPAGGVGFYVERLGTLGTGGQIQVRAYYPPSRWAAYPSLDSVIATSAGYGCHLRTGITGTQYCGGGDSTSSDDDVMPARLELLVTVGSGASANLQVGWSSID